MATWQLTILDEGKMTPAQLMRNVTAGDTIEAKVGPVQTVSLRKIGAYFTMVGYFGRHSLNAESTDALRLHAHWHGFVDNNRRELARQ